MTDSGSDESTIAGWSYIPVDDQQVAVLRETVLEVLPDRFEGEDNPHISVLPKFTVPKGTEADATQLDGVAAHAEQCDDIPETVAVNGISFFPAPDGDETDRDDPYVVMLDVTVPTLASVRATQQETIHSVGGEVVYEPVPAHVTLAKAGDGVDADVDGLTRDEIQQVEAAVDDLSLTELQTRPVVVEPV